MARGGRRLTWPVVGAAVVVLTGGGSVYAVASRDDAPTYRTVTARTGDVEQTLTYSGLVDAARRSDLSFGTDGTVARVLVAAGDRVRAGQVLARLATADLDADVTEAVAAVATARAQLDADREAQTQELEKKGVEKNPQSSGAPQTPATPSPAVLTTLRAQQQAVLDAQSAASAALSAADDALAAQKEMCVNAAETTLDACTAALADVQAKQAAVKEAQESLAHALGELTTTLSDALRSLTGKSSARTASESSASDSSASDSSASDSASGAGPTVTAAQLAADQAQIDQAEADLVAARAARAQATLRSTRGGTVASLDLARGDAVTAGTAVATVVGGSAVTLTGTVDEAVVDQVRVGQTARVTVPGSTRSTTGTVTRIGLTADTSSGSTRYPVTVTVEDPSIALPTGSRAQVAVVVATARDVVTLPLSAVTRQGTGAVVRTWDGSTLERSTVTIGAVGARTVQVTDGVEAGDEVVLADVDQEITGASSTLQRGGFGPPPGAVVFRQGGPGGGSGPVTVSR